MKILIRELIAEADSMIKSTNALLQELYEFILTTEGLEPIE